MTVDRHLVKAAVPDGCVRWLCSYMVSVVQLYGVSRLCSYMLSVGCAVIWRQSVVQLYGVSRLCSYMLSVGCAVICCQFVVQLYGSCYYTAPPPSPNFSIQNTCEKLIRGGRQFPTNNIKLPISFELVNNQYMY